ncbi:hypothetical protein LOK49_LG03G02768 [Camellia lanceoleosa]|uniref:Uncharacterized protein n=1 Tax=Camellia lanceoleosa TaxID=1840588 RepID=A0ACC0IEW9_9ERIC|nr:hypothetical protein LOK49_LG03G02768 [Camellia lanceoleosa]
MPPLQMQPPTAHANAKGVGSDVPMADPAPGATAHASADSLNAFETVSYAFSFCGVSPTAATAASMTLYLFLLCSCQAMVFHCWSCSAIGGVSLTSSSAFNGFE